MAGLMISLTNFLVAQPSGLWETIIFAFNSAFKNYAWAIILLTLCIKIVLSPLDYFNKKVSKDNAKVQQVLMPEMAALNKKYENDKNMLNQKTAELYKKHNVNLVGSCVFMLVNLVVTFTVFLTLFSGLNSMAAYKVQEQYNQLKTTYHTVYEQTVGDTNTKTLQANTAVALKYEDVKDGWLWIENVWIADSPLKESILSFDEYIKTTGIKYENIEGGLTAEEQKQLAETEYNLIMNPLKTSRNRVNGYFIITAIVVLSAVGSQLLMQKGLFKKGSQQSQQKSNKILLILMPLLLGYFTLMYNAVFGLYIATGQLFAMATSPLIELIQKKVDAKKDEKRNTIYKKGRIVGGKK